MTCHDNEDLLYDLTLKVLGYKALRLAFRVVLLLGPVALQTAGMSTTESFLALRLAEAQSQVFRFFLVNRASDRRNQL